jgi:hypothetical protein
MELKKNLIAYVSDTKAAIAQAIKNSHLSRQQIADRMNEIIGNDPDDGPVTVAQIDSWTKKDDRRTSFFKYLPVFCAVTDSILPIQANLSSLGLKVISGKRINLYDLGESEVKRLEAARQRRAALARLGFLDDAPGVETNEDRE